MAIVAYKILKIESLIKQQVVKNHALFICITFSQINAFT